jgi:serine phosphatase RsbU (regulator of sigma subunit)
LKKNEQLQTQVTRELEVKVLERTREIESARERIERQALDIRDSISYARSIQNALLPSADEVKRLFERNFILYLPRDVVSGDFYWVARKGNRHYLAVADCTGHGVPGALVSVLCVEKLEQALLLADDPSMILRIVNDEVKRTLRQSIGEAISTSRDGMDVALMAFDTDTGMLSFAGAKRPLWLIRDSEVIILQSTRFSIGGHSRDGQQFEEQRMKVRPGDTVYLFSDGYADQFGGAEGRKFTSARFRESLLNISLHAMSSQQQELSRILSEWKEKEEQVDDVLVVGVRF